jgi:glycerophosphoryl diester phosphodiesterase
MKSLCLAISGLLFVYGSLMLVPSKPVTDISFYNKDQNTKVIAHRGGRGIAPGNTIEASANALQLGASIIELDIQLTKDNKIVARHDASIDTTSNGKGMISEMYFSDLQKYRYGFNNIDYPIAEYARPLPISLLETFFEVFSEQRFLIEIKPKDPSAADALCETINAHDFSKKVLVGSFNSSTLRYFRRICPNVPTSLGRSEITWAIIFRGINLGNLLRSPGFSVQLPFKVNNRQIINRGLVQFFHNMNMKVDVWTVNDEYSMRHLLDLGVDGIITDYPDLLVSIMKENQKD